MGHKIVDQDGIIHERGWDRQLRPKQGVLGPEREIDRVGNPRLDRDLFGAPKPERDWRGGQVRSAAGRPLYRSARRSGGNVGIVSGMGWIVGITLVTLFYFLVVLGKRLVGACRGRPKLAYPFLAGCAVVGFLLSRALFSPVAPAAAPPQQTYAALPLASPGATPTIAVVPTVIPSPTPETIPKRLVVGNTGADGVYVRRTPAMADRVRAWPDGTVLLPTGRTAQGEGREWYEVKDPDGFVGWVPTQYVVEAN